MEAGGSIGRVTETTLDAASALCVLRRGTRWNLLHCGIGPARLNYARVIPMVDYTARVLGRVIEG